MIFRFFLYSSCLILFWSLTWGQSQQDEDPKLSLISHIFWVGITLIGLIDVWVNERSQNAPTTHQTDSGMGAEAFAALLLAIFWGLYYGLKWQLLPAAAYKMHLVGSLRVVFVFALVLILWAGGIFDRK